MAGGRRGRGGGLRGGSAGADMIALEWDLGTWTIARRMTDHRGAVCAAAGLPAAAGGGGGDGGGGELLATASIDGFLKVWSPT